MEILIVILICIVAILILFVIKLLRQPKEIELPEIKEMEEKLRFALASEASMREVQNDLKNLPNQLLFSITRSLGKRTGKLNELLPQDLIEKLGLGYSPLKSQLKAPIDCFHNAISRSSRLSNPLVNP